MKSFRGPVNGHLPGPGTSVQGRQKRGQPASSEGAALERKRIKKSQCMFTDSTWYAWYLVCESLCWPEYSSLMAYKLNKSFVCQETKTDLASLCLVSKAMNDLATTFLYRSISLRMLEETLEDKVGGLLYRLLDTSHDSPRCFVRELTISRYRLFSRLSTLSGPFATDTDKLPLSQLIERLPNLRQVRLELACDFSSNYMKSIDEHPQKPELHLLAGGWGKPCPRPLPRVTEIRVMWGTECEMRGEQRPLHQPDNFLNYITSCPNLKSCSWVAGNPKETVIGEPPNDIEGSVIHKPFPFLEHLDLYQYYIGTQMWHGWEDYFNWSSLSSLEIGQGLFAPENLNVMTGRLSNLKRFKITGNDVQNEELCRSLETFLVAFDTLVDLELLNCFVPIHAITRHNRLANLCVHIIDTWSCLDSRTVFESEDLISLDALCPQLENLQLDIERDNEKEDWPQDVLETVACSFSRVKTIALHSRVGNLLLEPTTSMWNGSCYSFMPKLTYKAAREIGTKFFAIRYRECNASSGSTNMSEGYGRLQKLTLKSGGRTESMPFQCGRPVWLPRRMQPRDAQPNILTFDMLPPKTIGEEPKLVHLERERQEKLCQDSAHPALQDALELIISIAEDGPRRPFRRNCGKTVNCRVARPVDRRVERGVPRVGTRRSERLAQRREMVSTVD